MEHYTAILLAGGESRRMGVNKAEMKIGNITLLERALSVLDPVVDHIIVMLGRHHPTPLLRENLKHKISFGRDSCQKQGPLQGIADAIPLIPGYADRIYVITCDLPYLTSDWLNAMKDALKEDIDVVHAVDDNITNPLLALYRKKVLMRAKILLDGNQRRPISLWEGFRLQGVFASSDNPKVCQDINTPEEFEKAQAELSRYPD